MKKRNVVMMLAAALSLVGCVNEEIAAPSSKDKVISSFKAFFENDQSQTRTTIAYDSGVYKVSWEDCDEVCVLEFDELESMYERSHSKFKYDLGFDLLEFDETYAGAADFSSFDAGTTYEVYYPFSLRNTELNCFLLPQTQSPQADNVISNLPQYGRFEVEDEESTPSVTLTSLCGALALQVDPSDIGSLRSIRVSAGNRALWGQFTVSEEEDDNGVGTGVYNLELTDPESDCKSVIYDLGSVTEITQSHVYYIVLPAGTYKNIKIELSSDGSNYTQMMSTKTDADITISRNVVYPFNFKVNSIPLNKSLSAGKVQL